MKKLSKKQMKRIVGGLVPVGNSCSADCPAGSSTLSVSCPVDTKVCSSSGQCVTCDGTNTCCTR